jgi:zinc protease
MRAIRLILAATATLIGAAQAEVIEGRTPKGISYVYERATRGDGVAVYFAWRYARDAEADDASLLHYLVPAMTFGAGGESKETIERRLRELQASFGSYSPMAGTLGGFATFDRSKTDPIAALLAQIVQKPEYSAQDLDDRYRKVLLPLRDKFNKDPLNHLQFVEFSINLPDFADHVRFLPMTEAGIKPPARERLLNWQRRKLGRNNLLVSVAGNLSEGDAGSFIDRVFGALPMVEEPARMPEPAYRAINKVIKIERDVPQVYARLYGALESSQDPVKSTALRIAVEAFGNGKDSTLYRVLREELGAAYGTSAGLAVISPRLNLLTATAQIDPEKAPAAIDRLREEYRKLAETGLDEAAVSRELARLTSAADSPTVQLTARTAGNLLLALRGLPPDTRTALSRTYRTIVTEQINKAIAEGLPKAATLIVMAPASVAIKADCTIRSYAEAASCTSP